VSYGAELDGTRYFVKTAGRPDPGHRQRCALIRNAARIGETYRHPALPRLRRVIESPHGPVLVYDWADGELLHAPRASRDDPTSAFHRFRTLPADRIAAALDTVIDVHELFGNAGEVAGDFYDGCLIYDFAAHRLSLIDTAAWRTARSS
jgi:serine/threonine-protein kinase